MRRADDAAVGRRQEHGEAIGDHDRAGHARLAREAGIRLDAVRRVRTELGDAAAVDLAHEDRARGHRVREQPAIGRDRTRLVAHVIAEVEAVERRPRDAAAARRAQRAHARGRRPVGRQQHIG
jgi:hypothetical protein